MGRDQRTLEPTAAPQSYTHHCTRNTRKPGEAPTLELPYFRTIRCTYILEEENRKKTRFTAAHPQPGKLHSDHTTRPHSLPNFRGGGESPEKYGNLQFQIPALSLPTM